MYPVNFVHCSTLMLEEITVNSAGASGRSAASVICVAFVKHVQNSSLYVCIFLGLVFIHPYGVKRMHHTVSTGEKTDIKGIRSKIYQEPECCLW